MEYKTQKVDGHEVYYSADWVKGLETEIHFKWYYHQAKLIYDHCQRQEKILEIGVGTGLLSNTLKKRGWNIQTLDIDAGKQPDHCASALDFDYAGHDIETVVAFEIFEHIPFTTFEKVIKKLSDSNIKNLYFSLPWNEKMLVGFELKLPKIRALSWSLWIPRNKITTHAHFWELTRRPRNIPEKHLVSEALLRDLFTQCGYVLNSVTRKGAIQFFSANLKQNP
jgi:hypothetical protein